jgi:choline-sulfatase
MRSRWLPLFLLLVAACRSSTHESPPSVILVSIDTLRADHVGVYGYSGAATPTIDSLAERGTRFEMAYSPAPLTLPAHTTLLTGLYPPHHGVRHNGMFHARSDLTTLAERFSEAGFDTAAVVGATVLDRSYGLDQGFAIYDDEMPTKTGAVLGYETRQAEAVTERGLALLKNLHAPFFLFLHYFDPHAAYEPPEPYRTTFSASPYDGEVAYVDAELRRLVDALDKRGGAGQTVLVVTADHGESLGEHNEKTHSYTLYDATLRIPLIFVGTGIPRGRIVHQVVSLADVAPTILSVLGLPALPSTDGRDLVPLINGRDVPALAAYAETLAPKLDQGWSPLYAARSERYLFARAPRPELYEVRTDPGQSSNLLNGSPDPELSAARSALDQRITNVLEQEEKTKAQLPDPATREQLRALGYEIADSEVPYSGMDPKDGMWWVNTFFDAAVAVDLGQYDAPGRFAQDMVKKFPASGNARWLHARVLMLQQHPQEALPEAQEAARLNPRNGFFRALTAEILLRLGRREEAAAEYERAAELDPLRAGIRRALARTSRGEVDTARREMEALIRAEPRNTRYLLWLARLDTDTGHPQRAIELCDRALEVDPGSTEARTLKVVAFVLLRLEADAEAVLSQMGEEGQRPNVRHEMAQAYLRRGDRAQAERIWEELNRTNPDFEPGRQALARLQ